MADLSTLPTRFHRVRRLLALGAALSCAAAAGGAPLQDPFADSDRLITNEYAYWNPSDPQAARSGLWDMNSGSLFCRSGAGWTGKPDDIPPNPASTNGTNSAVFRMTSHRSDFGDVSVSFSLLNRGLSTSPSTPAASWDGIHLWLRYQGEAHLYYASFNRRDGTSVIKKKVPGGPSNGGTYYELSPYVSHPVPYGAWQKARASVVNNPDGSVTIRLYDGDKLLVSAVDDGSVGGAPIRAPGRVGIRGDNADLTFDDFTVTDISAPPPGLPVPPAVVTAEPGDGKVIVRWDPAPGAVSYNLYRSRTPGVTRANGYRLEKVSSPHVNTGFVNGTAYYMVVTAVNARGEESAESVQVSAVPRLLPPPAPTSVKAVAGDAQVTISWTPVPGASSYNLYRSRTAGVTPDNGYQISGVASPHVNKGFVNGTAYYMVVTALNAAGESLASVEVRGVPSRAAALGAGGDGDVRVYPNPWRGARDAGAPVRFHSLAPGSAVKIFTLSGEPVAEVPAEAAAWDLRDGTGDPAPSGMYVYQAVDGSGARKRGFLGVIR
jgi:hypothetical protein